MVAPPYVRLTLIISTKRNTWLHYSYGCATLSRGYVAYLYLLKHWVRPHNGCPTLSAAYAGYLYIENHWVKRQLWVRHLKCSLCWLPLFSESLGYTTHMGV